MNETKTELRRSVRQLKKAAGADLLLSSSASIVALMQQNAEYLKARRVMLYYPLWDEPDTRSLINKALAEGKRVILPTVSGDDIIPVEVTPETRWVKGRFDIMEPQAEPYTGEIDFILVPGVAFDLLKNRLGRGRGYYDRFLACHPTAYRLGICFDFQVVEDVPTEPFDLKMHSLLVLTTKQ